MRESRLDLALDLKSGKQRYRGVVVEFQLADVVGHHAFHELVRLLVDVLTVYENLADFVGEIIPDGADDGITLLVDQEGPGLTDDHLFDRLPDIEEIVEVPAQLFRASADTRGAHDTPHPFRGIQVLQGLAHDIAVLPGDAPGYAPRAGVIRHEDEKSPSKADESRQCGTLVTAFLLLHLNDDLLTFLQDVFDLDTLTFLRLADEVFAGDFLERQKAVTLRPIVDERSFETGFDSGQAPFVYICFPLFSGRYLDVKVVKFLAIYHGHAQLFLLSCID